MSDSCDLFRESIDDAVDGRLAPDARAEFLAHVRRCPACAAEWELATALRGSLLNIGLDPAPPGLRESIAAKLRRPAPAQRFPARGFLRAAALVLVTVTIGWLAWSGLSKRSASVPSDQKSAVFAEARGSAESADKRAAAKEVAVMWNADPAPAPLREGLTARLDERTTTALKKAREIATRGPEADRELNRVVTGNASPEQRQQQAEFLVLLLPNVGELSNAAGDASALSTLARDADDALTVFSGEETGGVAKGREKADAPPPPAAQAKRGDAKDAPLGDNALKVERTREPAPAPRAPGEPPEPAFYMVSGPGAITRVERVLNDRGLRFQPIRLTERSANERMEKLQDSQADYRIIEVEVPEASFDETIGDLESLVGLKLAPVGRADAAFSGRTAAKEPKPASGPAGGGARGAPRGAVGGKAGGTTLKSLSIRKLRLVLMGK